MAKRLQLDREALLERARDRSADLLTEMSSILQGGVLSAAGFGLIEIMRHPSEWPVRVMLWLIGMIACFIIYYRVASRAPFFVTTGTAVFVAMPLLGICEVALFAVLTLDGTGAWRYWFFAATATALSGAATNLLEMRRLRREDYVGDAEQAFEFISAKLRFELIESLGLTALTGGLGVAVWLLPAAWPYFPQFMGAYLVVSLLLAALLVPREAQQNEAMFAALDVEAAGDG
jgi:hypothetical protein